AGVSEQTLARAVRWQADLAEVVPVYTAYPVVFRQALIEEAVVGGQEFAQRPISRHDVAGQQARFLDEGVTQVVVEGITFRRQRFQFTQAQPLAEEVVDQRLGPRIGEHAPDFRLQYGRLEQAAVVGQLQQAVVGNAAPQEEGQARGHFVWREGPGLAGFDTLWRFLEADQEARVGQDARQPLLDAGFKTAFLEAARVEGHQRFHVDLVRRHAIGAPRELAQHLARAGLCLVVIPGVA